MQARIIKVNNLLRNQLAHLITREVEFKEGTVVTVMRTEAEADLKTARVFVRVFPKTATKKALQELSRRAPFLQSRLNRALSMRFVPKLSFAVDQKSDTLDAPTEVEQLLDSLKNQA